MRAIHIRDLVQKQFLAALIFCLSLLAAAAASFPLLTTGDVNGNHSPVYDNAIADPEVGSGDGSGGG
ncbi:MAG: hypothetical protein R3A44_27305 [Caldilineaceae bacterium]